MIPREPPVGKAPRQGAELRQLAFFDELLDGFITLAKLPNESVSSPVVKLVIHGLNGQAQTVTNVALSVTTETETQLMYQFKSLVPFPKLKLDEPFLKVSFACHFVSKTVNDVPRPEAAVPAGYPADRRNVLASVRSLMDTKESVLLDSLVKDNKIDIYPSHSEPELTQSRNVTLEHQLPIIRLLNLRVRNTRLTKFLILSTIDIEPSSKAKEEELSITIDAISYNFQRKVKEKYHQTLPQELDLNDSYSLTFQLETFEQTVYKSLIEVDYSVGERHVKTKLITSVDFFSQFQSLSQSQSQTQLKPGSLSQSIQIRFLGNRKVPVGQPFPLKVRLTNTSTKSRSLVLVFNGADSWLPSLPKIKAPIHSNLSLLKNYTSSKIRSVGVVSLVNEVHIKSEPGKVDENEITLMGLQVGVYNVHGVKLVDLNTGESISCDKYLEIIVN